MFNVIGDWNPQLLRELKGQLKPLKIVVAIAIAIIGQLILLITTASALPGSLSPYQIQVTTYPEITLRPLRPDAPAEFTVQSLTYRLPLEHSPGKDLPENESLRFGKGDRILAVDGVSLISDESREPQDQEKRMTHAMTNSLAAKDREKMLTKAINKPFAADIRRLRSFSKDHSIKAKALASLRQAVPGTSVTLTVKQQSSGAVMDVTLPRIVSSSYWNDYCVLPTGWNQWSASERSSKFSLGHQYQNSCQVSQGKEEYRIDWSHWHRKAFVDLNLATILPLLLLGSYSIINNLLKEERDGTFNFIRLSPRSAWEILGGKIVGVPILIYGAVLLTLPLNLIRGLLGDIPLGLLFSFYGTTILLTVLSFSFAALLGLVRMGIGVIQAWLGAGAILLIQVIGLHAVQFRYGAGSDLVAWILLFTPFSWWRWMGQSSFIHQSLTNPNGVTEHLSWFGLPLVPIVMVVLMVVHGVILGVWVWNVLARRFCMPTGTIISKAQSYGLTLFVNVWLLGFSWRSMIVDQKISRHDIWLHNHLMVFAIAQMSLWVILFIALAPRQQSLQDWARYRHQMRVPPPIPQSSSDQSSTVLSPNLCALRTRSVWWDLVWGEKSPMVVAIALNLLMSLCFTMAWLLYHVVTFGEQNSGAWLGSTLIVFTAATLVMLIGITLVQFVFLSRQRYASVIALLLLVVMVASPPLMLALAGIDVFAYPYLWFLVFPWVSITQMIPTVISSTEPIISIFLSLAFQAGCLGLLNGILFGRLKAIGESDTKALLRDA